MDWTPLIETTRGPLVECQHWGAVAVADRDGRLLAQAGNPQVRVFTRSTIKPFQALPLVQSGAVQALGWGTDELAMLCASHSGESFHARQTARMLASAGQGPGALQCGQHPPLFTQLGLADVALEAGDTPSTLHHNCSGKHAGFVAYCVHHGLPLASHLEPGHPLQRAVRASLAQVTGMPEDELVMGIDGCSAPNYALPLQRLAQGYARLAAGWPAQPATDTALRALADAMVTRPDLVSGTGRHDLDIMRAGRGDWVSKTGADGVQVVGSRSRGQAFALKVLDGNITAQVAAAVEVMAQLGWLDAAQAEALAPRRAATIPTVRGRAVGERRAVLQLQWVG